MEKKGYNPEHTEKDRYKWWESEGFFIPDPESDDKPYTIVIPPPNVTGSLHMGHGLNNTLQDILIRYYRMNGYKTLWVPGMDHAGIATQYVVERQLKNEGTDRHELGREKFIERVWEWVDTSGGIILNQLRKLGCSCDWSRQRFTMDEGLSRAVREVFVRLWEEGLIYRGKRLINWCPRCHTALSDLEVLLPKEARKGKLWHLKYPLKDGGNITVATTRPETMLGDTAVAVNPGDERYAKLIGKAAILPFLEREMPIIGDEHVDLEFGTGALKITPAHDFDDFEIGTRHNLEFINIFDRDAKINENGGPFEGMDRYKAREKIVAELEAMDLLGPIEDYPIRVGRCYRCQTEVEPWLSDQWFVKIKPLADEAAQAVRDGRTRIVPQIWEKNYFEWMDNIRDWCISRQIWWGHRIPAWYCDECDEITVSREDPDACSKCGSKNIRQETDVLDTWFSSALWPFSTLGWPDETSDLATFYPTSVLVTAFDILFFWVARMMMMGLHFMGDVPFDKVYIHAMVRDEKGEKMSKSRGNIIDPLVVISEYGADAFRFTLAAFAAQGRDIKLDEKRIEGYRHFCNKIFQAAHGVVLRDINNIDLEAARDFPFSLEERWIRSRLGTTIAAMRDAIETYKFNEAATAIYNFIWLEYCDWFIEMSKPALYGDDSKAAAAFRRTLVDVLDAAMRLLHPIMPFLSEDIWQELPVDKTMPSIMLAPYPVASEFPYDEAAENEMNLVMGIISAIRNIRGENSIKPGVKVPAVIITGDDPAKKLLEAHQVHIKSLGKVDNLEITAGGEPPPKSASSTVSGGRTFLSAVDVHIPLEGLVDFAAEVKRLEKEKGKVEKQLDAVTRKLSNEQFTEKAPPDIVEKEREKREELFKHSQNVDLHLERMRSFL